MAEVESGAAVPFESPEELEAFVAAIRHRGGSRDVIHDELLDKGLTAEEAADYLDQDILPELFSPEERERRAERLAKADPGPSGIGGWLILPAIGLPFGILRGLKELSESLSLLRDDDFDALEAELPGIGSLVTFEIVGVAVLVAAYLGVAILFYAQKRATPHVMIGVLFLQLLLVGVSTLWASSILPDQQLPPGGAFGAIVAAAIWIPYFLTSVRVRNTFVR